MRPGTSAASRGAEGLAGLVYDDGGSSPEAISERRSVEAALAKLDEPKETPWLAFGGIAAPDLGLFSATGSALTAVEPKGPSQLERFVFLPPDLRSPITPVTNEAASATGSTSAPRRNRSTPPRYTAAWASKKTAEGDGLHGWNGEGALTPVHRYAEMLAGSGNCATRAAASGTSPRA